MIGGNPATFRAHRDMGQRQSFSVMICEIGPAASPSLILKSGVGSFGLSGRGVLALCGFASEAAEFDATRSGLSGDRSLHRCPADHSHRMRAPGRQAVAR